MLKEDAAKSLESAITMMLIANLELKGKKFEVYISSSSSDTQEFRENYSNDRATFDKRRHKMKHVSDNGLKAFYDPCCNLTLCFLYQKCGEEGCIICKPVHTPKDEYKEIKHLPDPMLREEYHYLPFCNAFKKKTSESDRPSLANQSHYHSKQVYNLSRV